MCFTNELEKILADPGKEIRSYELLNLSAQAQEF